MSTFTKKDLQTGMLVKFSKGTIGVVMRGGVLSTDRIVECNSDESSTAPMIRDYDDEFVFAGNESSNFTIVEIRSPVLYPDLSAPEKDFNGSMILWKREEPKELTVSEIEKLLGYHVKVVKE